MDIIVTNLNVTRSIYNVWIMCLNLSLQFVNVWIMCLNFVITIFEYTIIKFKSFNHNKISLSLFITNEIIHIICAIIDNLLRDTVQALRT